MTEHPCPEPGTGKQNLSLNTVTQLNWLLLTIMVDYRLTLFIF